MVIEHRIRATHDLSGVTDERVWTACQRTHEIAVFADKVVVVSEASVPAAKSMLGTLRQFTCGEPGGGAAPSHVGLATRCDHALYGYLLLFAEVCVQELVAAPRVQTKNVLASTCTFCWVIWAHRTAPATLSGTNGDITPGTDASNWAGAW